MRIKVSASTGSLVCRVEDVVDIPESEVERLTPEELEKVCQKYAEDWLWNILNFNWTVIE